MTVLRKTNGGVRGIVVGMWSGGLVASTIAQQLGPQVEAATAPFQYGLSTRAGTECVAHVIQGLCEVNPDPTVMSIDGLSAYDQISRAAMLDGLYARCGGKTIPFVQMFHGSPSTYIWEDGEREEHTILQEEGSEQGDPLMPLLYSLGLHSALEATQEELTEDECLLAYLDDIYVVSPDRASHVYTILQRHLCSHARFCIKGGKTQVWNRSVDQASGMRRVARVLRRRRIWQLEFGRGLEGLIYH